MARHGISAGIVAVAVFCGLGHPKSQVHNRPLTEVRFESVRGGMPFFAATVNASGPLEFLLDTGGSGEHVDREIANRLGLKLERARASVSGSSDLDVGVVPHATIAIGGARHEGPLVASPLAPIEPILGRRFEGIIGGAFLRRYVLRLDYDARVIRLYEPAQFHYNRSGHSLPLSFTQGIPFVTLDVSFANGKSIKGDFLIDTAGGGMAIHVHKHLAEREGLLTGTTTLGETGHGLGGETSRTVARAVALSIGPYRLPRPFVAVTEDTAGLRTNPNSIGLVGMEVLGRFDLTFDYSRAALHLEPNRTFNAPFVYNSTGLSLRATRPSFSPPSVHAVRDPSPAKEAGIEAGDVVLQLDGRATSTLTLDRILEILKPPGRRHELTVSRKGTTRRVSITTRDLLG
jgi:predicted aspartyl protease